MRQSGSTDAASSAPVEPLPAREDAGRDEIARRMHSFAAVSLALALDIGGDEIAARVWRELRGEVCSMAVYRQDGRQACRAGPCLLSHAGFPAPPRDAVELLPACAAGSPLRLTEENRPAWIGTDAAWLVLECFGAGQDEGPRGCVLFALSTDVVSPALQALLQQVARRVAECLSAPPGGVGAALPQQELRRLLEAVQKVRADEMRLLAREVHDQLGQLLTAARIDIRLLERRIQGGLAPDREETLRDLGSALSSIDQAIASVQDLSILLRPPALEAGGLLGALRWLAGEFQRRHGIACELRQAGAGYVEPPRFVAGELFRICQEALTNVLRHADASRVLLQVSVRGRKLLVRVCDDGVGIARHAAASTHAIGLAGMRERAASISASLAIHGRPSRGTILSIRRKLALS
jgi:signal transduction histidine kinase